MTYGLLIKDSHNNTILGPKTFTVRAVDSRISGVGRMSVGQGVYLPMSSKVKKGMFAIVMPLIQYRRGYTADLYSGSEVRPLCLPSVTVHDGYVLLQSSYVRSSEVDGNVAIYVFTNV